MVPAPLPLDVSIKGDFPLFSYWEHWWLWATDSSTIFHTRYMKVAGRRETQKPHLGTHLSQRSCRPYACPSDVHMGIMEPRALLQEAVEATWSSFHRWGAELETCPRAHSNQCRAGTQPYITCLLSIQGSLCHHCPLWQFCGAPAVCRGPRVHGEK